MTGLNWISAWLQADRDPREIALGSESSALASRTVSHTAGSADAPSSVGVLLEGPAAPVGSEALVNTTTAGRQNEQALTELIGGGFVVVWEDSSASGGDTSSSAIRAQVFASDGSKVGGEILVNTTTANAQRDPAVASLANGNFVVTWEDNSRTGGDLTGTAVRAQIFAPDGTSVGNEILANSTTLEVQENPAVLGLGNGGFVIAWQDQSQVSSPDFEIDIRAQVFAADGTKVGSEFLVNSTTVGSQVTPMFVELSNGGFLVAWETKNTSEEVRAQVHNADGSRVGGEILINTTTTGIQSELSITSLDGGGFVASWTDFSGQPDDASGSAVRAQVFANNGSKVGNEILVPTTTRETQDTSQVLGLKGGGFVVLWDDAPKGGGDVRGQVFDANGTKIGSEFIVNGTTSGRQSGPVATALENGGFAVSWLDDSQTGDDTSLSAIRGQVFAADGARVGSEFLVPTTIFQNQVEPAITGLVDGSFAVGWLDRGDTNEGDVRAQVFAPEPIAVEQVPLDLKGQIGIDDPDNPASVEVVLSVVTGVLDVTAGTSGANVSGSGSASVTITGTLAQVQALLDADATSTVTYTADSDTPPSSDDLTVTITDVTNNGAPVAATETINITAVNDPSVVEFAPSGPYGLSGTEFLVNTRIQETQDNTVIERLAGGGFVVSWVNEDGGVTSSVRDIRAQVYDDDGNPVGPEIQIVDPNSGTQVDQAIAALPNGGFIISWTDVTGNGGDSSSSGVRAQIFDADGSKVGNNFDVNTVTLGSQEGSAPVALSNGNFLIAWEDNSELGSDASNSGVKAQLFASDGTHIGSEIEVNTTTLGAQEAPQALLLSNGNVFIAWISKSLGAGDLMAQIIAPDGTKIDGEIQVNGTSANGPRTPVIAQLDNGNFVIAWQNIRNSSGQDDVDTDIRLQLFDSVGTKIGDEVIANTTTSGNQVLPAISALVGGGFVLTWEDPSAGTGDTEGTAIRAQIFDSNAAKSGAEILVNTTTGADQKDPSVTALPNGGFFIVWEDSSQSGGDTSSEAIRGQFFAADGSPDGPELLANSNAANQQINPLLLTLANGSVFAFWDDFSGASGDVILPPAGEGDVRGQAFAPQFNATEQVPLDLKGQIDIDDPDNPASVEVVLSVVTGVLDVTAGTS
ncbi:MAG: hypothetical protein QNJ15_07305, partial [Erythrobacter sp.]|nr:hypothetical protein [Erythrobacter sp.]